VIPPNAGLLIESYTFKVATPSTGRDEQIDLLFRGCNKTYPVACCVVA
jgi:hypothetical protein